MLSNPQPHQAAARPRLEPGGGLSPGEGIVTPGPVTPQPRQTGCVARLVFRRDSSQAEPSREARSPGHGIQQRGKISGPGEDRIPRQPGTAAAGAQTSSVHKHAALPAVGGQGGGHGDS